MPDGIGPLPSQAVTAVLVARNENLGRVAGIAALRKTLDADEETAARLLRMMGIGIELNVKA